MHGRALASLHSYHDPIASSSDTTVVEGVGVRVWNWSRPMRRS